MRAAAVAQVLQGLFYVLLHVLFYLWSFLKAYRSRSCCDMGPDGVILHQLRCSFLNSQWLQLHFLTTSWQLPNEAIEAWGVSVIIRRHGCKSWLHIVLSRRHNYDRIENIQHALGNQPLQLSTPRVHPRYLLTYLLGGTPNNELTRILQTDSMFQSRGVVKEFARGHDEVSYSVSVELKIRADGVTKPKICTPMSSVLFWHGIASLRHANRKKIVEYSRPFIALHLQLVFTGFET